MRLDIIERATRPQVAAFAVLICFLLVFAAFGLRDFSANDRSGERDRFTRSQAVSMASDKLANEAHVSGAEFEILGSRYTNIDGNTFISLDTQLAINNTGPNASNQKFAVENPPEAVKMEFLLSKNGRFIYKPPKNTSDAETGLQDVTREEAARKAEEKLAERTPNPVTSVDTNRFSKVEYDQNEFYLWEPTLRVQPNQLPKYRTNETVSKGGLKYLVSLDGDRIFLLPYSTQVDSYGVNKTSRLVERTENIPIETSDLDSLTVRFSSRINDGRFLSEIDDGPK